MSPFAIKIDPWSLWAAAAPSSGGAVPAWLRGVDLPQINAGLLLKATAILVVGWLVSRFVRWMAVRALRKTKVDHRLAHLITGGRSRGVDVEKVTGNLLYALMMIFVWMEVLTALGLDMITQPLSALVGSIFEFFPRMLAAVFLGLLAWAVANAVRMLSLGFLAGFDVDRRLGDPDKPSAGPAGASLTRALADALYYLVFLFFLPQVLQALRMEGLRPVQDMVGEILGLMPSLFGAGVLLVVVYYVARLVRRITVHLLAGIGFDRLPEQIGLGGGGPKASVVAGRLVMTALLAAGAVQASETLGLSLVARVTEELLVGLFRVLVACAVFAVGLYLARVTHRTLSGWESQGDEGAGTPLASAARAAILFLSGAMALSQSGLAPEIVRMTFGALVLAAAVAGGLAFGLGGRESAARWLESRRAGGA